MIAAAAAAAVAADGVCVQRQHHHIDADVLAAGLRLAQPYKLYWFLID